MYQTITKRVLNLLICFSLVAGLAATANAESAADSVVFGKFRLVKNGHETRLSAGFPGNTAVLRLSRADTQEKIDVKVREDGEFSIALPAGDYYLTSIEFRHRGATVAPATNFMFNVSPGFGAHYVGTITLETTVKSGYYGTEGSFDRFIVSNDCASDCDSRLAAWGLEKASSTVSLPEWQQAVASNQ